MINPAMGQKIRELRQARGMSMRALADKVGVSIAFLHDLEHGRRSTGKIDIIALELGADPDQLLALSGRLSDKLTSWLVSRPDVVARLYCEMEQGHSPSPANVGAALVKPWNTCIKRGCGQLVDLPDPCFDGSEVRCGCGRLYVVVEFTGGTHGLNIVRPQKPRRRK